MGRSGKALSDSITVITTTRGRPDLLRRSVQSLLAQDYPSSEIVHEILVDSCRSTAEALLRESWSDGLSWHFCARSDNEVSGPPRLAKLRNEAVRIAQTRWVAFLDDDNTIDRNHLSSLIHCAQTSKWRAVHSLRRVFWRDGSPFLSHFDPWVRNERDRRRRYEQLSDLGYFRSSSNIVHDRASGPASEAAVDAGEWLLDAELARAVPFPESFSIEDWERNVPEDRKFMLQLMELQEPIACTNLPTLNYYLGGLSNEFSTRGVPDTELTWQRPQASN